ncbi:MAG: biopolymer transporter ExbD [Verrucomicrobia bacterium]|nr:biopolymer transporter ExbD [Verrucomicrobiota bacterium]MBU1735640.1 biopolymer transporter ExbD [Verrucomicrobiota bacterium]MBU1856696.1 biopolymer transporter ExbD [Verrucomicrobiota bacterium]
MKKKWLAEEAESCALQMGPMMDCVFLLILYFVSVSTIDMVRISKKVHLPGTHQGIVEKDESGQFIVDIEWDEGLYEPTYKVGVLVFRDPLDLTPIIEKSAKLGKNPNFRVILRADRRVPYEFTQQVMASVAAANVPNMLFSTVEKEN